MRKAICAMIAVMILGGATAWAAGQEEERAALQKIICSNPANATQKAICDNPDLKRMDDEMRQVLDKLMSSIPQDDERTRADLIYSQQRFAHVRRLCHGNLPCLKRVYASRLKTLRAALAAR